MNFIHPRKMGIMGGTFDPIHYGHLLIAQSAAEEFDLDQVLFLPTGKSPHKAQILVTEPKLRCEMVRIAISRNPDFKISVWEAENREINYTYLTLRKFHEQYENTHFYFIMGEDSLHDFPNWKNPCEICRLSTVLVAVRNDRGDSIKDKIKRMANTYAADMHMLHAPNFTISSREIRERIRLGKSVRYMIPEEVETFIRQHYLYMEQD